MPWTFSHPAAVLPLRALGVPFSALVVGSLAPDFGYYVGLSALATQAHGLPGLFAVCLPSGLLVLWAVRALRPAIVDLLPQPHRGALARMPSAQVLGKPRGLALDAIGLVLGAATHVLWDGFTHARGLFVAASPLLAQPWGFAGITAPAYAWLQHGSTVLGAAILAWAYWRWLARQPPSPAGIRTMEARRYAILSGAMGLALATAVAWVAWRHPDARLPARLFRIAVLAPMLLLGMACAVAFVRRAVKR